MLRFNATIIDILNVFHENGHEAFVVGGCVRDTLLSRSTLDIDLSTSATIEQVKTLFKNQIMSETGVDYQSLAINFKDQIFQVTSYRQDSEYEFHRFPKTKKVVSYQEDVWRRDFTMNGLFWNPNKGLVDLVDGLSDIKKRQIKTIDDPMIRFEEDALRILRAVRFACELDFEIESKTYEAMMAKAYLLKSLSRERITQELLRSFQGVAINNHIETIRLLFATAFNFDYYYDKFSLTTQMHPLVSFLLIFKSKTQQTIDIMSYFAFNKKEKELILMIDENSYHSPSLDKIQIKTLLRRISMDAFGAICQLHRALNTIDEETYIEILCVIQDIHLNEEPYLLAHLKIKGDECVKRKMPFTQIASFLNACLEDVIVNPENNTFEYLSHKLDEWNFEQK